MATKDALVEQVKSWQRQGQGHKVAWWNFCSAQGSEKHDPKLHDETVLQSFLAKTASGEILPEKNVGGGGGGGGGRGGGGWGGGGWGSEMDMWAMMMGMKGKGFGKGKGKSSGLGNFEAEKKVWVGGLPDGITFKELQEHFNQAGKSKWAETMKSGTGGVAYGTKEEAAAAIATLNGSILGGAAIQVDVWTGGGGGGEGKRKWSGDGWPMWMMGKGGGKQLKVHGEPGEMVYIGNLPKQMKWQELKDHMKQAGDVKFVKIHTVDGTEWGRSKGSGCVRYGSEAEALKAVATLNGTELMGNAIVVDKWTEGKADSAPAA